MRLYHEIKNWDSQDWLAGSIVATLLAAGIAVLAVGFTVWFSDTRVDHCYVVGDHDGEEYKVFGNVPWREDRLLGTAKTGDEAYALMTRVCPIPLERQ